MTKAQDWINFHAHYVMKVRTNAPKLKVKTVLTIRRQSLSIERILTMTILNKLNQESNFLTFYTITCINLSFVSW